MASDSHPRAGDPPELSEDVDVDMETRRYILDTHAQLDRINYYAMLGVNRAAEKKAIKDAYFRLAGLVHPDRYFGKKLGSYKPKMEQVFARISLAYDTLSKNKARAEYDAQLGQMEAHDKASGRQAVAAPVDPRVVAKRQAALEGLKAHFAEGRNKAKQYAEAGARARAAGDLVAASEAYRSALTFAPTDPELKAAFADVERAAGARLAESHMRKAQMEERFGRWAAAVESWQRVVAARPDDAEARAHLANAVARARGNGA
jgi:curved DNA-binding protein CbpA